MSGDIHSPFFFSFFFSSLFLSFLKDDSIISGASCTCNKHGQYTPECAVGSYCWDSGRFENSGCKTEAAPAKCSTFSCTSPMISKGGYCDGDSCTEAKCCSYADCTGETFSQKVLLVLLNTLLTPLVSFLLFFSFFLLFFSHRRQRNFWYSMQMQQAWSRIRVSCGQLVLGQRFV